MTKDLYNLTTEDMARELLGYSLCRETADGLVSGIIVETEAYLSKNDAACHSARGMTKSNATMFGPPGRAYVYYIYGRYNCFNVVSAPEGVGEAVLIRAVEPLSGINIMSWRRGGIKAKHNLANGPGKLCQAFAIDRSLDGHDLRHKPLYISIKKAPINQKDIIVTPRIGVSLAQDKKLRFMISGNKYLSRREFRA